MTCGRPSTYVAGVTVVQPPGKRAGQPTPAERRRKNTRRIAVIAGTAALTTAVSGIVGGIISPDRVQSVVGLSDDPSDDPSVLETETPGVDEAPTFKRVSDGSGAISVDVPATWAVLDDGFVGIPGVTGPGVALRAGPDPADFRIQSDETAYVGASAAALGDLGLVGLDDAAVTQVLKRRREQAAYLTEAGCIPTNEHAPDLGTAWVGAAQAWEDCFDVKGWRAVEVEMVSVDRATYVFVQIGLPSSTSDRVGQQIVDSLTVLASALPATR